MAELVQNAKSFFVKCKRVWFSLRKPTMKEFQTVTKITALGALVLGAIGFVISLAVNAF